MNKIEKLKDQILLEVDKIMSDLIKVNKLLFENPELSEQEYNSVQVLTKELTKHGFKNRIGVGGLETSFESSFECNGNIPAVSFLV